MSHFAVLVIGEDVEGQLEPYREEPRDEDAKAKYFEFHDQEEEFLKEYNEDGTEMVRLEDGSLVYPWNEMFRVPGSFGTGTNTHKVPDHLKEVKILNRDRFASFEEFVKEWHGQTRDPQTGRYGYWRNPNAQWDWWTIGGRYAGRLKSKAALPPRRKRGPKTINLGLTGDDLRSFMAREKEREEREEEERQAQGFVNQARFEEIDWEGMREKRIADRTKWWAEYEAKLAAAKTDSDRAWAGMEFGVEKGMTREQYMALAEEFSCFAVVKNGKWYQKGDMGWWGCVSNEKDESAWKTELKDLMADLKEGDLLTIVDCHI